MSLVSNNKYKDFKHGSIVRIELENFMIYRHIEFRPGPFLNLILGPNGSGKSALVCSIIMGFGGDPQITGRSSNLIDYIRFGAQSATISIEIYSANVGESNYLIQREIRVTQKGNKNECHNNWKLNGRNVNKAAISEFIKQTNIDINNLCQILPQERVAEFSRLNPRDLLFSTEKSIGDVNMYDNHMRLILLSEEILELERKIKESKAFMLKCQNFKTNIEPDLKLIKQKKHFEKEIQWLMKKQVWLEFEEKRLFYTAVRSEYIQKKDEYDRFVQKIKPLKTNIAKAEKLLSEIKNDKVKHNSLIRKYYSKISDIYKALDTYQNNINDLVSSYNEKMSEQKRFTSRLAQYEQDWNNYKNDLLHYSNKNEFETQANQLKAELNLIESEIKKIIIESSSHKNQLEQLISEKRLNENKKKEINNLFNVRMEKVNQKDTSTRSAYEWLLENQNKFKGQIFPPLITQINVIRDEWVNYVETAIGSMDMSTFLFENLDDLELFCKELKNQLNIRVNVAMIPEDSEDFNEQLTFNIEMYKSFGIFARVSDLFTAPDKVMSYLIKTYHVNQIPVGDNRTEEKIHELINSSPFRKIITNRNHYSIVISAYDNEKSIKIMAISPAKYLNIIIEEEEINRIDEKLTTLEESIKNIQSLLNEQNEKMGNLKKIRTDKSEEFQTIESKRNAISKIEAKIQEKERQIKLIKESVENVDKNKQELAQKLTAIHVKQLNLLQQVPAILSECLSKSHLSITIESKIKLILSIKTSYEKEYSSVNVEEKNKNIELQKLNENFQNAKKEANDYRDRAKEKSGFDFNNETDLEIKNKLDTLPTTLEEVNNAIDMLKMRCEGIKIVDNSLLEEYKNYQREIKEKTAQCNEFENQLNLKKEEIDSLKPIWLEALQGLINKINSNFSSFMDYLNYSGEVYLFTGHKEYTFDDYGIRIKVKFRDSEPMKDLDAYHQSGGERSISTMIYMLSLQELAHVPFRVVDEINQGMDEKNERCVFDLIAKVSRKNSSQYFLLSPKLLTNLNYTPEMKIHVIFNGPHIYVNWTKILSNLLRC